VDEFKQSNAMTKFGITAEECKTLLLRVQTERKSMTTQKARRQNTKGKRRVVVDSEDGEEDGEEDELEEDDPEPEDNVAQPSATIPPIRIPSRVSAIGRVQPPQPEIQPPAATETIVREPEPLFLPGSDDDQPVLHGRFIPTGLLSIGGDKGRISPHAESRPTTPPLSLPDDQDDEGQGQISTVDDQKRIHELESQVGMLSRQLEGKSRSYLFIQLYYR
jgi:hypothetical protein